MIVFLDSTALLSDPHCEGVAWSVLVHASQAWGLRVITTDVVLAEVAAGYERHIRETQQSLSKLSKILGPLGLKDVLAGPDKALREAERSYSAHLEKRLVSCGVDIMPVPAVPHMRIVERSVARRRPCDDKGDGYRDTLNWLTFLGVVQENQDDHLIFSTNDSDFISQDGSGFHQHLLEDLDAIGASERVSCVRTLKDLVLHLAKDRSMEIGEDLQSFADQLRNDAILAYLSSDVLPTAVESALDVRACALPLGTESTRLLAFDNARDLHLALTGQISNELVVGEFEVVADTDIEYEFAVTSASSESLETSLGEEIESSLRISKPLVFRGIITMDIHGQPQTAEISAIEALPDDSGHAAWEAAEKATLGFVWGPALSGLAISPDLISGLTLPTAAQLDLIRGLTFPTIAQRELIRGLTFPTIAQRELIRGLTFPTAAQLDLIRGLSAYTSTEGTVPGHEQREDDERLDERDTDEKEDDGQG